MFPNDAEYWFFWHHDGIRLYIQDHPMGGTAKIVCDEVVNFYRLPEMVFQPGDVVLDVGAQVGVVSLYLATRWPGITVYAFEPMPENYALLRNNIQMNRLRNVKALNVAVTGDGRPVRINGNVGENAGGPQIYWPDVYSHPVDSVTLYGFIEKQQIDRVALLKLDCEGAEYEILGSGHLLLTYPIRRVRCEIHTNNALRAKGWDAVALSTLIRQTVPDTSLRILKIPDVEGY